MDWSQIRDLANGDMHKCKCNLYTDTGSGNGALTVKMSDKSLFISGRNTKHLWQT